MLLLIVSAAVSIFIVATIVTVMLSGVERVESRLMDISAAGQGYTDEIQGPTGIAGIATGITSAVKPLRDMITSNDEDLGYRLALAGFRKPEHVEIYTAAKLLLPVLALAGSTFTGDNMMGIAIVGVAAGFFGPDVFVTQMISRRKESIRKSFPDALDLLSICMEAGLGIDQALVRVGSEIRLTSPALAEEFLIVNREQRAGKPRLEAWRSVASRLDIDFVRQFVAMLVQTERFGTPIAEALSQFADGLRMRRMQEAEEKAAKAGIKLLFPLVLFIFPAVFVVALGPAILTVGQQLEQVMK